MTEFCDILGYFGAFNGLRVGHLLGKRENAPKVCVVGVTRTCPQT